MYIIGVFDTPKLIYSQLRLCQLIILLSPCMILLFAWRYFRGKKSTQAIQIISWVSVGAMAVGTAALIIVLSVFNGFEGFIKQLYSGYYPELKISSRINKTFSPDQDFIVQLQSIKEIAYTSQSLEEKVLLSNNESQVVANLKGIDTMYQYVTNFKQGIKYGHLDLNTSSEISPIVLGIGVSNRLGANEETHLPINCYSFKTTSHSILDLATSYSSSLFEITGVYVLQDEIDNQYGFAPLSVIQNLSDKQGYLSSIELKLNQDADIESVKRKIQQLNGAKDLKIETRYEQNKTLYFILKSERWVVYAILTLMLIIASFNIVGSMSMLVLDKEKDIAILKTMGMPEGSIKRIFISTGILLSLIGAIIGSILAFTICLLQQYVGFVKLGAGESFLIEAYPVKMQFTDFILVLFTVVLIALFASMIPAVRASKRPIELRVK